MPGPPVQQITPPSAVILNERRYPIVTSEPTLGQTFFNFRAEEYKLLGGAVALGAPFGYFLGWKYHLTRASAWMGIFVFGSAALAHASQVSAARLMGILPNEREVKDYLEDQPGK